MIYEISIIVSLTGVMALSGQTIPAVVYAWTAVFVLPINSALNPFLFTLTAVVNKKACNNDPTRLGTSVSSVSARYATSPELDPCLRPFFYVFYSLFR